MLPWSVVWTAASAVLASLHRGCACLRYATVGMVPSPVSLRFRCAWGEVKWVEVMPVALASAGSLGPVLVYLLGAPRAPHADPGLGWVLSSVSPGGGDDAGEVVLAADSTRESRDFLGTIVAEIQVYTKRAIICYTIPISQSTPKTELLVGGRSEEFWVGNEAEASNQLVGDGAVLSLRCIASPQTYLCTSRTAGWLSPTSLQADPTLPTCVVCTPSITSLFFNRHKQLRYSWAVDLDAGR